MRRITKRFLTAALFVGLAAVLFAARSEARDDAKKLEEGKPAPNIDLPATQVEKVLPDKKEAKSLSLKDLQGKKNVILFFYPKAMTPGCTIESCGFRDKVEKFAELDTVIIGISTDNLEDQQKFTDKEKLNFPLFADADKKVAKTFGVLNERGFANRVSYVIDKKGVVRKIYSNVNATKHPEEVLIYVKENLAEKK